MFLGGEPEGGVAMMVNDELDGSSKEGRSCGSAKMESIKPQDKMRLYRSNSDSEMEIDSNSES
jgi:hypothetical protein